MSEAKRLWLYGLTAGAVVGLLDAGLIFAVEPSGSAWVLVQSFLAWLGCGWAVVASKSGLGDLGHGILVTLLLNLPWVVALSLTNGQTAHLPPLLGMSLVFGLIFGWVRSQARTNPKGIALT